MRKHQHWNDWFCGNPRSVFIIHIPKMLNRLLYIVGIFIACVCPQIHLIY